MKKYILYFVLYLSMMLLSLTKLNGENLDRSIYLALKNNETIKAQKVLLANNAQNLIIQSGKKLPSLTLKGSGARVENFNNNSNNDSYSISFESGYSLFDFGKLEADKRSVEISNKAASLKFLEFRKNFILKIIQLHLDLYKANKLVELYENSLNIREQQFLAVDSRFELGEATRSDVLRAKASISGAEAQLQLGKGNLGKLMENYKFSVGITPNNIILPEKKIQTPESLKRSLDVALRNDHQLQYLKLEEDAARENLKSSEKSRLPNLSLSGALSYGDSATTGTNRSSGTIALTSSVTLFSGGQKRAQVQISANKLLAKSLDVSIRRNELIQNVRTKWIELGVANSSVTAKKSEVDALKGLYDSVFEEWKLGGKTSLETDQAYQNMLNAEVDLITASVNVILAKYSLLKEIGTLGKNLSL